ncbi:MAG: cobalamin-binding protein [Spirochaetaceae bacterium]|jgi:iron complex transport system substrate-binding protein|nr:cobalamin-binding protein [Spirochaetaceae bacterium]
MMKKTEYRRCIMLAAVCVLAAGGFSACAGKSGNAPPVEERAVMEDGFPLALADALGRNVILAARPERIVSLSPALTEILFAIGAGDAVVGVTEYCDYPAEAKTKPVVGGFTGATIPVERVAAVRPDLVFISADMHERLTGLLDRLGIVSFAIEPRTFNDVYAAIDVMGRITGNIAGAEALIAGMREKTGRAAALRGNRPRPRIFWELGYDPLMTVGGGTWINDAITMAGGDNIFGGIAGQYPQVGLEQIILEAPAWILVAEYGEMGTSADAIAARPGWAGIPAVREGNIGIVDADSLYRFGPRLADATLSIAEILFRRN